MTIRPLRGFLAALAVALPTLGPPAAAQADAANELKTIESELKQEDKLLREAVKDAPDPATAQAIYDEFRNGVLTEFGERYAVVARANPASELGLEAWNRILGLAQRGMGGPLGSEALRAIVAGHLQSPTLAVLVEGLPYAIPAIDEAEVLRALRAIGEGSPHREVQAAALFGLGSLLGEDRPAGDPRLAEAKTVLARLQAYADLKCRSQQNYAEAADALVFALDNLAPGRACPEFSAVDAEGAAFRLSDYEGKVVLIDFWGFW